MDLHFHILHLKHEFMYILISERRKI